MTAALRHWATALPPLNSGSRRPSYLRSYDLFYYYALVAMTAARRHWATAKFSRSFLPAIGVIAGTHYQTSIQEVFHLLTRAHVALVILRSYDLILVVVMRLSQ